MEMKWWKEATGTSWDVFEISNDGIWHHQKFIANFVNENDANDYIDKKEKEFAVNKGKLQFSYDDVSKKLTIERIGTNEKILFLQNEIETVIEALYKVWEEQIDKVVFRSTWNKAIADDELVKAVSAMNKEYINECRSVL